MTSDDLTKRFHGSGPSNGKLDESLERQTWSAESGWRRACAPAIIVMKTVRSSSTEEAAVAAFAR